MNVLSNQKFQPITHQLLIYLVIYTGIGEEITGYTTQLS